jgi:hypothetical protein
VIVRSKARKISTSSSSLAALSAGRQVGHGVGHRHNLVGVVSGGSLGSEGVGDRRLARAQLNDPLARCDDDGIRRVVVLL